MRRALLCVPALALLLSAQVEPYSPRYADSPRWESLRRGGDVYLSLQDAIALAPENNLDVELQRIGPRIAETDLLRTRGGSLPRGVPLSVREGPRSVGAAPESAVVSPLVGPGSETNLSIAGGFSPSSGRLPPPQDPVLVGTLRRDHQTLPQVNSFMAGTSALRSDASVGSFGLEKGFLSGGHLRVSFDNTRQSINHQRYDLNPFTTGGFGVTFTQPLLRGFGRGLTSRFIRIAKTNRQISDLVFEQQVITTVAGVARLYWDLASLHEDVKVRRQTLERSEKLLSDTLAQVEAGTRAAIEAIRARAEVARSRRDLIASESLVRQQETILKDYLTRRTVDSPELRDVRLILTDPLRVDRLELFPSVSELSATALDERPDLLQARLQTRNALAALDGSRNALLPSLDLVASARNNGLAGDANALVQPGATPHNPDPALLGGYGSLLSQLARRSYPDYGVTVQLTIPLRNRTAEADLARDRLALAQQQLRLQLMEKQLRVEITNALTAIQHARAALEAAEREREFQEQALAAEEEKLTVGASTTYLVIQYQRDLAQARSAEVAATAAYAKARIGLDRATGNLLETYGISWRDTLEAGP